MSPSAGIPRAGSRRKAREGGRRSARRVQDSLSDPLGVPGEAVWHQAGRAHKVRSERDVLAEQPDLPGSGITGGRAGLHPATTAYPSAHSQARVKQDHGHAGREQ
jgi:hypothetical protein